MLCIQVACVICMCIMCVCVCVWDMSMCKCKVLVLKLSNEVSIIFLATEPQLSHEARAPSLPSISTLNNGKNYNPTRLTHNSWPEFMYAHMTSDHLFAEVFTSPSYAETQCTADPFSITWSKVKKSLRSSFVWQSDMVWHNFHIASGELSGTGIREESVEMAL